MIERIYVPELSMKGQLQAASDVHHDEREALAAAKAADPVDEATLADLHEQHRIGIAWRRRLVRDAQEKDLGSGSGVADGVLTSMEGIAAMPVVIATETAKAGARTAWRVTAPIRTRAEALMLAGLGAMEKRMLGASSQQYGKVAEPASGQSATVYAMSTRRPR